MMDRRIPTVRRFLAMAVAVLAVSLLTPGAQALVTGKIEGTVKDADGNPVGELSLMFTPEGDSGSGVARKVKVSKKASFHEYFFPTGRYKITSADDVWFVKYMKVVVRDGSNLVLNTAEGAAHPIEGLPAITVTSGLKIVIELTVAGAEEKKELVQQFALQESSGELKKILKLVEKGDHEKAVAGLDKILADNPELGAAQYLKGQTLFRMARYEDANACFLKTIELDADQPGVHGNLGLSLLRLGEKTVKAGDEEAAAEMYRQSVEHFDLAAEEDPDNMAILTSRAATLEKTGDQDRLIEALRGILAQDETQLQVRLRLADILTKSGQGEAALEVMEGLNSDDPAAASTMFNLAVRFYNDGELESAVSTVEAALKVNPHMAAGYRLLGRAKMSLGEKEAAIQALTKFLELAPGDPSAETEKRLIEALKAG